MNRTAPAVVIPENITKLLESIRLLDKVERATEAGNTTPKVEFSTQAEKYPQYERTTLVARPEGHAKAAEAKAKEKVEPQAIQETVEETKPQFEQQTPEVIALKAMMLRTVSVSGHSSHSNKVGEILPVAYEQAVAGGFVQSKTRHYYKADVPTNKTFDVTYRDMSMLASDIRDFLVHGDFPD